MGERESLDRQVATKQFTFIWTFSKLSIFPLIVLFLKIRFFLKKISLEIKILLYLYFCVLQKKHLIHFRVFFSRYKYFSKNFLRRENLAKRKPGA